MADTKISAETLASSLAGDELIPYAKGGANGALNPALLKAYLATLSSMAYVSGLYYTPVFHALNTSFVVSADTFYAIPFVVTSSVTVSELGISVTSAVTGNARLAIYSNVAGAPATKLAEVASPVSTGSVAAVTGALSSNVVLSPGIYWMVSLFSATPTVTAIGSNDRLVTAMLGASSAGVILSGTSNVGRSASLTYASGLPSTAPATTLRAGSTPLLCFRVA